MNYGLEESKLGGLQNAVARNEIVVSENPELVCAFPKVGFVIEVTGTAEFGAQVVLKAVTNRKHIVLVIRNWIPRWGWS